MPKKKKEDARCATNCATQTKSLGTFIHLYIYTKTISGTPLIVCPHETVLPQLGVSVHPVEEITLFFARAPMAFTNEHTHTHTHG